VVSHRQEDKNVWFSWDIMQRYKILSYEHLGKVYINNEPKTPQPTWDIPKAPIGKGVDGLLGTFERLYMLLTPLCSLVVCRLYIDAKTIKKYSFQFFQNQ